MLRRHLNKQNLNYAIELAEIRAPQILPSKIIWLEVIDV